MSLLPLYVAGSRCSFLTSRKQVCHGTQGAGGPHAACVNLTLLLLSVVSGGHAPERAARARCRARRRTPRQPHAPVSPSDLVLFRFSLCGYSCPRDRENPVGRGGRAVQTRNTAVTDLTVQLIVSWPSVDRVGAGWAPSRCS